MSATRLFIDWIHVDKGAMAATLDQERVSIEGWRIMEHYKRTLGIHTDLSGHGMKRVRLPYGVKITIEKARKSASWLQADRPWERKLLWPTVIHEEGTYRCWYYVEFSKSLDLENTTDQAPPEGRQMDTGKYGLCYAESRDGIHWIKPSLGLFSFEGSKDNHIVAQGNHESVVFRDDSAAPEERYKCFIWDRLSDEEFGKDHGLFGAVSPDGYRWTRLPEPLLPYPHDTQNNACWDAEKK